VKKTPLTEFAFRLARGKIAINLEEGDALVGAELTDGSRDILLFASNGKAVRFDESAVRAMGRTATGVRGIRLADGESVVSLIVAERAGSLEELEDEEAGDEASGAEANGNGEAVEIEREGEPDAYVLTATANGYGKRTRLAEYPRKGRGTQGVIGIQTTERNGALVAAVLLSRDDEVLLISDGGTLVRTRAAEVSVVSRNTQGVTLIRLGDGERLQAIERVDGSIGNGDAEDDGDNGAAATDTGADVPAQATDGLGEDPAAG
jgi:DNA gyrase subunit A